MQSSLGQQNIQQQVQQPQYAQPQYQTAPMAQQAPIPQPQPCQAPMPQPQAQAPQAGQGQSVQVPNYSGVNIQIFNPSVTPPGGTAPVYNVNAPNYGNTPSMVVIRQAITQTIGLTATMEQKTYPIQQVIQQKIKQQTKKLKNEK